MKGKSGMSFNLLVMQICLNSHDEVVASIIVYDYPTKISDKIISHAIENNLYKFLYAVWAFDKNRPDEKDKEKVYSYDYLFKKIISASENKEKAEKNIQIVADWKI